MKGRWFARENDAQLETILDEHFHTVCRWRGAKVGANEVNALDDILTAFQIDSGNNTWGNALCIVGSSDTPIDTGMTYYHPNKVQIVDTQVSKPYKLKFAWGDSYADGVAAGNYTEQMSYPSDEPPVLIIDVPRLLVGTKFFVACEVAHNTGTLDFFIGIHEYQI